jgi:predicted peptidase/fibronectin type 3 domain-containing protein
MVTAGIIYVCTQKLLTKDFKLSPVMKFLKLFGIVALLFFAANESFAQITQPWRQSDAPIIYQDGSGTALRSGTHSNRTIDGLNLNNGSLKTRSFSDMTAWGDSKFYDGKIVTNASMNSGSAILTTATPSFTAADANKIIEVIGVATVNGVAGLPLTTTISSYNSPTQVTLADPATVTVATTTARYGFKPAYTEGHLTRYGGDGNFEMNYRLHFPVGYNELESNKYPLIVMLHGAGERAGSNYVRTLYNGSITAGSDQFNGSSFISSDVGKRIEINGAGPSSSGNVLSTTILQYVNSTRVRLAVNATTTVTGAEYNVGTADVRYRNNDHQLLHGGQAHMEAIYNPVTGSNGKKPDDPTLNPRAFPGFVLFPQNTDRWIESSIQNAAAIVDLLKEKYKIDPDRIYLHGLSDGGYGVWEMVRLRPNLMAAVLPMSAISPHASPIFTTEVNKAVPIPAWIFQGGVDSNPTVNNTNQLVAKLNAAGAITRYKIYPTLGHATWNNAYAEPDFFSWMLKQNKRNITVLYGDTTLCPTSSDGVKMALGTGFLTYEWELDGVTIVGANTSTYTATQPGTYRARFSRSSGIWNDWSKPVVVRESQPVKPILTTTKTTIVQGPTTLTGLGTPHLPDINGGTIVRINGTTTKDLTKNWYVNNVINTTNSNFPPANLDTANYTLRTTDGVVTLKTIPLNGCPSVFSNSIYVTTSTPITLIPPSSPTAIATSGSTVQLFWVDNTPNETGFEIYRSPTGLANSFDFYKLVDQGSTSYIDTSLEPNKTYYYQLRAVNNTAASPYTSNISITTSGDTQPPTAPQSVTVGRRTLTSVVLSWTASTDNTGVASYNVYANGNTTPAANFTSTNGTATGLTGNSVYSFIVKAVDFAGLESPASPQVITSTVFTGLEYSNSNINLFPDYSLTNPDNRWSNPERTGITATFDISPRTQNDYFNFKFEGYITLPAGFDYQFRTQSDDGSRIYIGAQGSSAFPFDPNNPTTNLKFDNDGLHGCGHQNKPVENIPFTGTTGTNVTRPITVLMFEDQASECLTVEYKKSTDATWVTIPSSVLNSGATPTLTPPAAVTASTFTAASGGMTSINLNWVTVPGADYYEIYRAPQIAGGGPGTYSIIGTSTTGSYVSTGLTPSTGYYYQLKSVSNTNGSSGFSAGKNATTAADSVVPSIPTDVVVLSTNYTNGGVQWTASTDNVAVTGYKIFGNGVLLGTSPTTTFYTTALLPSTAYTMTVSAYDANGNESPQSLGTILNTNNAQIFYSMPSLDISQLASWNTDTNGTGSNPSSFSYDGQQFIVQNPQTLANPLTIGGGASKIIVGDGVTFTVSQPLTGKIQAGNNSTVIINGDHPVSFESMSPTSTTVFGNTSTSLPIATYGNLTLNGSGTKTIPAGTLEVLGNLTLASGVGLKGAATSATTVKISGDLIGTTIAQATSDNRVALQFVGATPHNLTAANDQSYSRIISDAGATVTFNNTSGSAKSLTLGTLNGGGLSLANGSTLVLGSNNLVLKDAATVNPTNTTGEISINNGSIQFTTSSATASNFYFATGNNRVQNFTLQTGGTTNIQKVVEIYDGLKINSGILNAGGRVTLKSTATASASIPQIVTGSITGNVSVERYMSPKRVYRYISSPVAGVKVSDWQNYFPITGTFSGASTVIGGDGNPVTRPSLYYYSEPTITSYNSYVPYPVSSNTETILPGRGYSAFIREGTNPTTLINTGVPNQGTIAFTLTGGTGASNDGYNLVGNPYASDIVWGNTGWSFNGVSNTIWVRENKFDGVNDRVLFFNRSSGSGTPGFNGKIPAGQAFWVQTTTASPTLSISESAKTTAPASSNVNFYRSETDVKNNQFLIKLSKDNLEDHAFVILTEDATDLYDKEEDGAKRPNSFFNLSTSSSDNVELSVNNSSNTFCEKTILVNLKPGEGLNTLAPGTYSLEFENIDNFSLAHIELVDSFLSTTTMIDNNSLSYPMVVTSDPASYLNRISLKLTRLNVSLTNTILADKNIYCRIDQNATISVQNSQLGVTYEIINSNSDLLSSKVIGNGETIKLVVPLKDLSASQTIRVRSYFAGCNPALLTNSKVITIAEVPFVSIATSPTGCIGGMVDVNASGNGKTYQWFNENTSQTFSENGNTIRISITSPISSYRVTAISESGCKSEPKNFLVRADSLAVPKVTLAINGIMETDGTKGVQWLLNGNVIPEANSSQYKPEQSGLYSVRTKNTYCMQESAAINYTITGIEGNGTTNNISLIVYPNPTEVGGKFTLIGSSPLTTELQLQVTDILGKEVITRSVSFEEYTRGLTLVTNLPGGVYIVFVSQNGKLVHQKIAIQ